MRRSGEPRFDVSQEMSRQQRREQERIREKEAKKRRLRESASDTNPERRARPHRRLLLALAGALLLSLDVDSPNNIQLPARRDSVAAASSPPDELVHQYYDEREQRIEPAIARIESSFPSFMKEIIARSPERFHKIFTIVFKAFQDNSKNSRRDKYALFRDFAMHDAGDPQQKEQESFGSEHFFFYDLKESSRSSEFAYFSRAERTIHLPENFGKTKGDLLSFFHEAFHVAQDNVSRDRIETKDEWDAYTFDTQNVLHMRNEWEAYAYTLEALNILSDGKIRSLVERGEDPTAIIDTILEGPPVVVETQAKLSRLYFRSNSSPRALSEAFKKRIERMTLIPKLREGPPPPGFHVDFSEYDVFENH